MEKAASCCSASLHITRPGRKGFLLSMDAIIAIGLILTLVMFISGLSLTYYSPELRYQRLYYMAKDTLMLLENARIGQLQEFEVIQYYQGQGILTPEDQDKTLLEIVGSFWATDNATMHDHAANISGQVLNETLPLSYNYMVMLGGDEIYQRGPDEGSYLSRLSTIISGIQRGQPVEGYVARAWATHLRKNTTQVITWEPEGAARWGGDLEIWKTFNLNYTSLYKATLYVSIHYTDLMSLTINGQEISGDINWLHTDSKGGLGTAAFGEVDVTGRIQKGNNTVYILMENNVYNTHVHPGMRLEITYQTEELKEVSETVKERYYLDRIVSHPNSGWWGRSGAWVMTSFYIPVNATILNVTYHIRAEDIEDTSSTDCRIWFNESLFDSFNPPPSQTVDRTYNFTGIASEGSNWIVAQFNYYIFWGDTFVGRDDTIIYSDPLNDPEGSSYLEVEYRLPERKLYYGYIDVGVSENAGGPVGNPKQFTVDFEDNSLIITFLHIAQLFSSLVSVDVWPEGQPSQRVFTSPVERAIPAKIYIDKSYFDASLPNYIEMDDFGCWDCDFLPETSLEYWIWLPSSVGYGRVNETSEGAEEDAVTRLNEVLGKYAVATSIETEVNSVAGVPTMWGPVELEVRVWN
jgi:hypothetical protein